ncbi:hypothetical protein P280DRAFT_182652 [Massarina eburnea CBS 473.64]|uniref:Uncharacterized protein n=1 Tax=Massarina eburnea CBS 473.64 TaxID=1395130 RepID=A0A6A6SEQ0_9PLEO|nr:hypothetical protein P280DRAFT_182652 [Massarina eburnea CBS 473.64]
MWKRLQGHSREKERQIGNPVLVGTTYDEDQLKHIPNVNAVQNTTYQPGPQGYDEHLMPGYNDHNRVSEVPTVSSIYSQPSPDFRYNYRSSTGGHTGPDISPPSSPEPDRRYQDPNAPIRFPSMRDVSPVDEDRGRTNPSTRGASNIPVLRKAPPSLRNQDNPNATTQKFWGGKVAPNSKVRWDEYSGEPTSSNAGKSASVTPGSYAVGTSPPSEPRTMGYHVSVTGGEATARKDVPLAERANRFGSRPPPVDTKPRVEPWSRATGRAEIAKPLKDQRSGKPFSFARMMDSVKAAEPAKDIPDGVDSHQTSIKAVVPLKVGSNSPPRSLASPISSHSPEIKAPHSYPSPVTPTNNQSVVSVSNGSTVTRNVPVQPPSEPVTPTAKAPRKSVEDTPESANSKDKAALSRFSWTTYNTSTTYQQSPPPSPLPPLPTTLPTEVSSILNRKRPVPAPDKVPTRKPVGESTAKIMQPKSRRSDPSSPRPDSTFSTSSNAKALPRPPTELAAADHIEILESQMEDLRIRRNNVYRLLKDLNDMAPPNPMVTDFRRMRLVEQRKKNHENELADIKVEEHDIGLKLHRAIKKREALDPNGGSALWVRRVTQ